MLSEALLHLRFWLLHKIMPEHQYTKYSSLHGEHSAGSFFPLLYKRIQEMNKSRLRDALGGNIQLLCSPHNVSCLIYREEQSRPIFSWMAEVHAHTSVE